MLRGFERSMRDDVSDLTSQYATRPAGVTLEAFADATAGADGLHLKNLAPLDAVEIRTRNSLYRISVLNPAESRVLVSGGAFFPVPTRAVIAGACAGGSMLKVGCILRGFRLEILHAGQRIVTTRIAEVRLNSPGSTPGPF